MNKHCAKCGKEMGDDYGVIIYLTVSTSIIMHEECHEIFKEEPLIPFPRQASIARITNVTLTKEAANDETNDTD